MISDKDKEELLIRKKEIEIKIKKFLDGES
jgi:hypothetical protein